MDTGFIAYIGDFLVNKPDLIIILVVFVPIYATGFISIITDIIKKSMIKL